MSPSSFTSRSPLLLVGVGTVIVLVGYTLFVASPYLLGPSITVITPLDQSMSASPTIAISGKSERVAFVSLNDQPIPVLEDGTFAVERAFPPGYTVLTIKARDRFGREEIKTVRFLNTHDPLTSSNVVDTSTHGEGEETTSTSTDSGLED